MTDKIWFVYLKDHHDGPFSLNEMAQKFRDQEISEQTYVWCEGMADWQLMSSVPDLSQILLPGPEKAALPAEIGVKLEESETPLNPKTTADTVQEPVVESKPFSDSNMAASLQEIETTALTLLKNGKILEDGEGTPSDSLESGEKGVAIEAEESLEPLGVESSDVIEAVATTSETGFLFKQKLKNRAKYFFVFLFLLSLVLVFYFGLAPDMSIEPGQSTVAKLADHLPILRKWFSPIPNLPDVNPEELSVLKVAAQEKPEAGGEIRLAIAISQSNPTSPQFYVASNSAEDLNLSLYVVGIPDTLLNQVSFSQVIAANVSKNLVKTAPLRMPDGQPIPKGSYLLYLAPTDENDPKFKTAPSAVRVPAALPKNIKILYSKSYFLGGDKDVTYASRLKEFHDRLRASAASEINDVKQIAATMESQLGSSTEKFSLMQTGRMTALKRKTWEQFHSNWMGLQGQLNLICHKRVSEQTYFYSILNELAQQTGISIGKVHEFQHSYFVGGQDAKTLAIQLGEATSLAQGMLHALKAKIEQAENLPATANGMPQRDGL